ncbi:MAG: multidrug ABC transporter permease [Bacteroidetes bacterium 46-16]|nr:MAG: multidrug ABC transporter permease [Bacteroidetes bacterium 46-16]
MKRLLSFVIKEFHHIFRDRRTMLILLGMPIVQIILFGFAVTNEVNNASIAIWDQSKDEATTQIIQRISSSKYFDIEQSLHSKEGIEGAFKKGKVKMVIVFPQRFRESLLHEHNAEVQLIADASDLNTASTLTNYASSIIMRYQADILDADIPYQVKTNIKMLYNPNLESAYNFVPGVMGLILMLISAMMTSVSIVREKEMGTMEVLLVSPVKAYMVIISKVIPYLVLSLVNIISIILLSVYALGVPVTGNLVLLIGESILFIITSLSLGITISTVTKSQQAAMLISMMGLMLPTILLSGFIFPIENMPVVLQVISNIVPAKWYIDIVRMVMIKGLGFGAVMKDTIILTGITMLFIIISLLRFKTRLE